MEPSLNKTIYALGVFDGVHLGHQALLAACRQMAREEGCKAGVVTFTSHPDTLVTGKTPLLVNSVEDRQRLFSRYEIEEQVLLPFDEKLRNMPWQVFLETFVSKGVAGFICGDDFRFGYRGEGNSEKLAAFCKERGLRWAIIPGQSLEGTRVSSTHIRSLLQSGQMEEACKFLGHPHLLSGKVVTGRQLGRTIDIPTANLQIPPEVIVPKFGVYACRVTVDGNCYMAVTNVGNRPTVGGHRVTVEPWLLDFEGDLYGKTLVLEFHRFLRPEKKFASLEELKAEIQKNAAETRRFFEKS